MISETKDSFHEERLRVVSQACAWITLIGGLLVWFGWWSDVPWLKSVSPGLPEMSPVTAWNFVMLGFALAFRLKTTNRMVRFVPMIRVISSVVAATGVYALAEQIRQGAFVEDSSAGGWMIQMAPLTACNFILMAGALWLGTIRRIWISEAVVLATLVVSAVALVGYSLDAQTFTHVRWFKSMAIHTAGLFMVLGSGILAAHSRSDPSSILWSQTAGGTVLRRVLPAVMIVPLAFGHLRWMGQKAGWYDTDFGLALMIVFSMTTLAAVVFWNARYLHGVDRERQEAAERVRALNDQLEMRVLERTSQLEAVNRELESFSYSVSHDLRAPLRAIDGFSKILLDECSTVLGEEGLRLLHVIRNNTARMGQLIDDLLSFSRVSRHEVVKSRIRLQALISTLVEELRAMYPRRVVEVQVRPMPDILGDPAMIRQAFANLLSNAFKFTLYEPNPRIEIGSNRQDGDTVIFVKDNGAGFDMAYQDKLFGVFQRLHTLDEFEGTGIGLAIVQRVIQKHGGRVSAEGEVGKGAVFTVRLPEAG